MLTRRTLLKCLALVPVLGRIFPSASSSTLGQVCEAPEYITSADGIRNGDRLRFELKGLPLPIVHSDFFFNGKEFSDGMDASRKVLLDNQRQALQLWPDIDIRWSENTED